MQELRKRQRSGEQAQQQLQRIDSVRSQEEDLSKEEVIRRLRLLGQPITLFGEVSNAAAIHQEPNGQPHCGIKVAAENRSSESLMPQIAAQQGLQPSLPLQISLCMLCKLFCCNTWSV